MSFILEQFVFYLTIGLMLFAPGYLFLSVIERGRRWFSSLERIPLSIGASILLVDFLMLTLGRFNIPLTRWSLILAVGVFSLVTLAISKLLPRKEPLAKSTDPFAFTKNQTIAIALIFVLAVFIRVAYLRNTILPSSTDLGHHMYWAQDIVNNGHLPEYTQRDIKITDGHYSIGQSEPISDFIIGEHLIFAAISLVSDVSLISYLPILVLFFVNLASLLAVFALAARLFAAHRSGKMISIFTLLFLGPLFAIAPPQAKYIGGGVIGNLLGNLLLPIALYFFFRALNEKDSRFLSLGIFFSMGLFYTHHLTGLIFLGAFAAAIALIILSHWRDIKKLLGEWKILIWSVPVVSVLTFSALFLAFIHVPSYLINRAVNTVVGEAVKSGHEGLPVGVFSFTIGESRFALGAIGILVALLALRRRREYQYLFLAAWAGILSGVAIVPQLFVLSVPSARVANYASFPLAILAAYSVVELAVRSRNKELSAGQSLRTAGLSLLILFAVVSGYYDNSQYIEKPIDNQAALQTFAASEYLRSQINSSDQVLKDHVYLAADSWVKLFFTRDYNFPLYRANFDRYENGIDKKEFCTLWMITTPDDERSQQCYRELNVNFVMVNRPLDAPQFERSIHFAPIYASNTVSIFERLPQ